MWLGLCLLLFAIGCQSRDAQEPSKSSSEPIDTTRSSVVVHGDIKGPIGPVTMGYVQRVVERARVDRAQCVVFTMDTPGGLDASMRGII